MRDPIRKKGKREPTAAESLEKGHLLVVKVPPFFDQEYFYEVTGAGGKMIRASLWKSPRVKRQWQQHELSYLFEVGIVRLPTTAELENLRATPTTGATSNKQVEKKEITQEEEEEEEEENYSSSEGER